MKHILKNISVMLGISLISLIISVFVTSFIMSIPAQASVADSDEGYSDEEGYDYESEGDEGYLDDWIEDDELEDDESESDEGYDIGYTDGYEAGFNEGYIEGYDSGYYDREATENPDDIEYDELIHLDITSGDIGQHIFNQDVNGELIAKNNAANNQQVDNQEASPKQVDLGLTVALAILYGLVTASVILLLAKSFRE